MKVETTIKTLLAPNLTDEEAKLIAEQEGCSGYYLIIPPSMQGNITEETIYPFVVSQTFEEIIGE
jgi:hypothetical protein